MIIKDYVCEAGKKISGKETSSTKFESYNEDFVDFLDHQYILVLDGSSGLGPKFENGFGGKSSAAQWFVQKFAAAVKRNIDGLISTDVLLKRCIREVKTEYYEIIEKLQEGSASSDCDATNSQRIMEPSASMALVRKIDGEVEVTFLGDITIGVKTQDGRISVIERGDVEVCDNKVLDLIGVKKKNSPERHVSDIMKDDDVQKLLVENRGRMNNGRDDGYLILGFDESVIDRAVQEAKKYDDVYDPDATGTKASKIINSMLIMSDGFAAHYQKYGRSRGELESLWRRADYEKLKYIYKDLRREEERDPYCDKYPRFKKSDDASAVNVHFLSRFYVDEREKQKTNLNVHFHRFKGRIHTARMYLGITKPAIVTMLVAPFALYDFITGRLFADRAIEDALKENELTNQSLIRFNWLGVMIFGISLIYLVISIVTKYRKSAGNTAIVSRKEIREAVQKDLLPSDIEKKTDIQ